MSNILKLGKSSSETKKIVALIVVAELFVIGLWASGLLGSAFGGYQSITAKFDKVSWIGTPNHQWTTAHIEDVNTNIITFDGNDAIFYGPASNTPPIITDFNGYKAEIENPKFDRNLAYNDWWLNDTVSAANPTGEAKHYEWSIDIYTVNVNFVVLSGLYPCYGMKVWAEFENNYNSVFSVLGAEAAASYVIYAQTENYTSNPAGEIISPQVSNFELQFLSGTITPGVPAEGSDLNFATLTPYSHVTICFTFDDFGSLWGEGQPAVNMVLELNVLTVGRFDYVLTYVAGGDNDAAQRGLLGIFEGIGAALAAGYDALVSGAERILGAAMGPLFMIAMIAIAVLGVVLIARSAIGRRK